MPTYDYACETCGHRFERLEPMSAPRETSCPRCGAVAGRVMVAGAGILLHGSDRRGARSGSCSFEERGTTCCGRTERCGAPPCE